MKPQSSSFLHRFFLPPGTRVEHWLLRGYHSHGAFGVVYRAVRVGQEREGEVALKMALAPWEPRFLREMGLLSLVQHPNVPRLLGYGFWQSPEGASFPFIVMSWVEGMPLYEWAAEQRVTDRQLFQVLAQLARALEATHARQAVHRDVKGDNVLVQCADGRAMLMDFGVGDYPRAARMTNEPLPPGTPPYRAPEAWLFERRARHNPAARYLPGPENDVYALGVTAYRLVTGEYPLGPELHEDGERGWYLVDAPYPTPRELNPRVAPQLNALILRMLSLSPEARGSAGELAQALEAEAEAVQEAPARFNPWEPFAAWRMESARALAAGVLMLWALQAVHAPAPSASTKAQVASKPALPHESATSLGKTGAEIPVPPVQEPTRQEPISQDTPPKPFPGQVAPDAKGQCPSRTHVPLNGGCWAELRTKDAEACEEAGYVFFLARCYVPVMGSRRKPPPTSGSPE